jgi:hypothetical protein
MPQDNPLAGQGKGPTACSKIKRTFKDAEKPRAILLYDASFNLGKKTVDRRMMIRAEAMDAAAPEQHVIAPGQFGSRKHNRAITHCINKRITFDHMRQLRHPGALYASDLKSCYDRVVHAIASLPMMRVSMPSNPIICMFTTIQDLDHHIQPIYGDSKKSFGGNLWLVPCQGLGQGNGVGPQIWAVVTTPVLNYLRSEGYGVAFKTSISGEDLIRFVGYAFVFDTNSPPERKSQHICKVQWTPGKEG